MKIEYADSRTDNVTELGDSINMQVFSKQPDINCVCSIQINTDLGFCIDIGIKTEHQVDQLIKALKERKGYKTDK